MSFVEELKRRRVFRVGAAYLVAGWVVLQVADLVLENVPAPAWVMQVLLLLVALGLPVALVLAWAFAWTPEGLRRERDLPAASYDPDGSPVPGASRSTVAQVAALLALGAVVGGGGALAWLAVFDRPPELSARGGPSSAGDDSLTVDRSLAVLPFADLSPEGDFGWFADGLSEEIINSITRTPDIQVASRTSSFAFRGESITTPEIADRLHVAHVLEGSVRRSEGTLRVTAQLIRADGFHLWSRNFDGELKDAIAIQTSLAEAIGTALQTSMDPEALADMTEVGTRSVPAYLDYLHGLSLMQQFLAAGGDSLPQLATGYFDSARETDPGFWKAHIRAALLWAQELDLNRIGARRTGLPAERILLEYRGRLRDAADAADSEAERLLTEALSSQTEGRLMDTVDAMRRYVDMRPGDLEASIELLRLYQMTSRTDESRDVMQRVRAAGERSDLAATEYVDRARKMGSPDGSDYGLKAVGRFPVSILLYQLHRALLWDGRVQEARGILARLESVAPDEGLALLPRARQACAEGDRSVAEELLVDPSRWPTLGAGPSTRWHLQMLLGDIEAAHEGLRASGESVGVIQWLPFLDYTQFDPSYFPELQALLEREGIDRSPPVRIPFTCPTADD